MRKIRLGLVALAVLAAQGHARAAPTQTAQSGESHPGLGIESLYDEAVVDYRRGQSDVALEALNQVLAQDPNHIQALELKGLLLKGGDDAGALKIYLKLAKLVPAKDRGPYFFEAGVLLKKLGQMPEAIEYFGAAVKLGFNVPASRLFRGMIYYGWGDPKSAQSEFEDAQETGSGEIQVVASYYLGMLFLRDGYPSLGTENLLRAQEIAKTIPKDDTAADTAARADRILKPLRNGAWFANLSLLFQYDTNISEVPGSIGIQAEASNNATAQAILAGGVGYMSSATKEIQWVPSYQFSWNNNFNSNTEAYDFFTNVTSLYVNYKPLSRATAGFKLQGNYTFNNAPDDPSDQGGPSTYDIYLLAGSFGPYFKLQMGEYLQLSGELDWQPMDFYSEPFSGTDDIARLTLRTETPVWWLALGASGWYELDATTNSQYYYHSAGLELFDAIRPTMRDTLTVALDYIRYDYVQASPSRQDTTWNPKLTYLHAYTDKWSLIGDLGYTTNASTLASAYSYNRWVFGAGVNYIF